jgi:type I restriction enzyme S subunit
MSAGLKPYPAYKDSGATWLGDVPRHWSALPNRALFTESNERGHPEEQMLSVTITKGVIKQTDLLQGSSKKDSSNQDRSAYKLARPGDIVYNKMRAWQGAVGISDHQGIVSPAYVVQRPHEGVDSRFFHYLLRTPAFAKEAERWSYGITSDMWSLRPEHFKLICGCLPPLPEQTTIVRFLSHLDQRVRHFIRARQKLVQLLEEQKQAIVQGAVTRGLDPNVRLKPSGEEWLGDVPEHWEVVRSGSMFRLFGGYAFPGTGFLRDESDTALPILLTPVNFDPIGGLRFGPKSIVRFRGDVPDQFRLQEGALVTVLTDLSAKRLILGRAGFIEHDGVLLNQRTARVDIHAGRRSLLNSQYLCWVLNSRPVREQTIATSRGSTVFHTSPTRMLAARWPLPPLAEQLEIVERLETLERTQRAARESLGLQIEFLREYCARLTADVVTGKLDVREVVANLPDVSEEPGPPEDDVVGSQDSGEIAELATAFEEIEV